MRWLGFNLWLFACVSSPSSGSCWPSLGPLLGEDEDDPSIAGYAWMCLYLPVTWPLYMAALAFAAPRSGHPRRWAIGLVPLLFALFPYAVVTFTAPGVARRVDRVLRLRAPRVRPPLTRPASGATSR